MKVKGFAFCEHKRYFDTGLGLTNYFKYIILFYGATTSALENTMWMAGLYAVACYFLGMWWLKSGLCLAETEVSNKYNLFVHEMRKKIKTKKFK